MKRENFQDLPVSAWTDAEALSHLTTTFDRACRLWPDLMEPYVVMLMDLPVNAKEIMRAGLRETGPMRGALR